MCTRRIDFFCFKCMTKGLWKLIPSFNLLEPKCHLKNAIIKKNVIIKEPLIIKVVKSSFFYDMSFYECIFYSVVFWDTLDKDAEYADIVKDASNHDKNTGESQSTTFFYCLFTFCLPLISWKWIKKIEIKKQCNGDIYSFVIPEPLIKHKDYKCTPNWFPNWK